MADTQKKNMERAQASKEIKKRLRLIWTSTKFTVRLNRYSGGNSITVAWSDGPTSKQVKSVIAEYENLQTDEATGETLLGSASFVSASRRESDAALAKMRAWRDAHFVRPAHQSDYDWDNHVRELWGRTDLTREGGGPPAIADLRRELRKAETEVDDYNWTDRDWIEQTLRYLGANPDEDEDQDLAPDIPLDAGPAVEGLVAAVTSVSENTREDVTDCEFVTAHLVDGKLPCPNKDCGEDLLKHGVAYNVPYINKLEVGEDGKLHAFVRDKCYDASGGTEHCNVCLADLPPEYKTAITWD